MFDEKLEMVASRVGPLAERAVEALESIAESLGTMSRTAELQAELLTEHQHHAHMRVADVSPKQQPLRAVAEEDLS